MLPRARAPPRRPALGGSLGGGGVVGSALVGLASAGMLQEGQLQQFESYCEKLYTSPDANERAAAEAALVQQHGQSAPLEGPYLAPCASPGRAWWPWLVRHTRRESPQAAKVLELVA